MIELPPLPYGASQPYGYTEAEMRAYGEACARAAIEAAADLCDAERSNTPLDDHTSGEALVVLYRCTERIRALAKP
jgi:hypothetical protein